MLLSANDALKHLQEGKQKGGMDKRPRDCISLANERSPSTLSRCQTMTMHLYGETARVEVQVKTWRFSLLKEVCCLRR
jgi:hypothetical protein